MAGCGTTPMYGGKRRTRKAKKMRGGTFYGMGKPITVGTLEAVPVSGSQPYSSSTGQPIADPFSTKGDTSATLKGGRRHRKTRKLNLRKRRKSVRRSRKMRGGMTPASVNAGSVGVGFVGGIPNFPNGGGTYGMYSGYPAKVPAGDVHPTGADGVKKV